MRWAMACTGLLLLSGAAFAGERRVPSDYSTIQAAVDAAASGDVIVCAPGTYTEAVVATKSNITIKGTTDAYGNRCIWDGKTGADAKTCLDITGNAVVVTDFDFKNGIDHCKLKGNYCQVKKCTSKYAAGSCAKIEGDFCEVNDVKVEECTYTAIKIVGKVNNVFYTSVNGCRDVGIDCDGEDSYTRYCKVDKCDKGGIRCKKPDVRPKYCKVKDCEVNECKEFGIHFETDIGDCLRNKVTLCGDSTAEDRCGVRCVGDDNYCHDTTADRCKGEGIRHKGNRGWHYGNICKSSERSGCKFEGNTNDCDYGRSENCGKDGFEFKGHYNWSYVCDSYGNDRAGQRVEGDENYVDYGRAEDNEDGYRAEGDRNDHYRDDARNNRDDGYDVERGTDNSYRSCTAKYNDGAGCENGGSSTDCNSCTFLYNSIDIGLVGGVGASFGSVSLNIFGSGSVSTILGIGLGL